MKTITLYHAVHKDNPEEVLTWLVPIDDRMLELGYTQASEQVVEIEQLEPHVIAAAIARGDKQREALAKQNNNIPFYAREQEKAA